MIPLTEKVLISCGLQGFPARHPLYMGLKVQGGVVTKSAIFYLNKSDMSKRMY